jgi:hypothetical protein
MSNLRAMDHRLGRRASDVDARAAQMVFLNQRDGPPQIGEAIGERIAGLAGTDDDGIVFHTNGPPEWNGPKTYYRMLQDGMSIDEISKVPIFVARNAHVRTKWLRKINTEFFRSARMKLKHPRPSTPARKSRRRG